MCVEVFAVGVQDGGPEHGDFGGDCVAARVEGSGEGNLVFYC